MTPQERWADAGRIAEKLIPENDFGSVRRGLKLIKSEKQRLSAQTRFAFKTQRKTQIARLMVR